MTEHGLKTMKEIKKYYVYSFANTIGPSTKNVAVEAGFVDLGIVTVPD